MSKDVGSTVCFEVTLLLGLEHLRYGQEEFIASIGGSALSTSLKLLSVSVWYIFSKVFEKCMIFGLFVVFWCIFVFFYCKSDTDCPRARMYCSRELFPIPVAYRVVQYSLYYL